MFSTAILKLTARCNLNCTYCYMFNLSDRTYARVPPVMALPIALAFLERVRDYSQARRQSQFTIVLHGGEPTLWPVDYFRSFFDRVESIRNEGISLPLLIQTNGVKLSEELLDLFEAHRVAVGISLDGPKRFNDERRINHGGRGSYEAVMATVHDILERGRDDMVTGFLCVADPRISPVEFLDWIDELPIRRADVLWPIEYNYLNPPWGDTESVAYAAAPTYGRWFADLFSEWLLRGDPSLYIRSFYQCMHILMGSPSHCDAIGVSGFPVFAVNTSGMIEQHDYLRAGNDGATNSELSVVSDDLMQLEEDERFAGLVRLGSHLPSECANCPHRNECGGGFLPGRVNGEESIPLGRSVLCDDHFYFWTSVKRLLAPELTSLGYQVMVG